MDNCARFCPKRYIISTVITGRCFSVSILSKKSHYDTLGVTPKATMADIKKAYYNLSMVYHPDKTSGNVDALEKFRKITEAYEVLSNLRSKKFYDKGLLRSSPIEKPASKPQLKKTIYVPQEYGRTPIYNFEEWTRAHYGESIARRASAKMRYAKEQEMKKREDNDKLLNIGIILSLIFIISTIITKLKDSGLDSPGEKKKD